MSQADRDRWNARYLQSDEERPTPSPSPFLASLDDLLPRQGTALDIAGGAGDDALWLVARGLQVTLVDIAPAALERAASTAAATGLALATHQLDLDSDPLPAGPYDLITCFNFLDRRLFPAIPERLKPGGLFVYSQPTRKNLERHAHPSARFLLEDGELPGLVSMMQIVHHQEAWFADRHEARLVARR